MQLFRNEDLWDEIVLHRNKEFVCGEGVLWFDSGVDAQADELGGYKSWFRIGLQRAIDGSVVGQVHSSSVALALWVIPMGRKQIIWYRWPDVSRSNNPLKRTP